MQPLTKLSAEEKLFRDTVRRLARQMDERIFDLARMAVEIPEECRGEAATSAFALTGADHEGLCGGGIAGTALEGTRQL